ncbi:MAG: hypothetical protein ABH851_07295 [Methanobacteriota archaeon]
MGEMSSNDSRLVVVDSETLRNRSAIADISRKVRSHNHTAYFMIHTSTDPFYDPVYDSDSVKIVFANDFSIDKVREHLTGKPGLNILVETLKETPTPTMGWEGLLEVIQSIGIQKAIILGQECHTLPIEEFKKAVELEENGALTYEDTEIIRGVTYTRPEDLVTHIRDHRDTMLKLVSQQAERLLDVPVLGCLSKAFWEISERGGKIGLSVELLPEFTVGGDEPFLQKAVNQSWSRFQRKKKKRVKV